MEQQALKISRARVTDLLQRLIDSSQLDSIIIEVKRMLRIKRRLALYSDVSC